MDKSEIKRIVKEEGVEILRLLFTDVIGRLKGLNITVSEIDRALDEGVAFDGSSIEGFVRIEESDLLAVPDLSTFRVFPFESGGLKSAIFICDVTYPDGRPLESDPRRVLRRMLGKAAAAGFDTVNVGPELEYFVFANDRDPTPIDSSGYFDLLPLDASVDARKKSLSVLQSMGFKMEASHHEVAPSQHEIDFRYGPAMEMADAIILSKVVVKEVARRAGLYASFMPKPIATENGSGMHVHQSLFNKGVNAFYSPDDPYNLSKTGQQYVGGLLRHSKEITAVTNQWVNSYKRLVPGYEAPANICWGRRNRTALVRVPAFKEGKSSSCRVEYRAPDSAANPYLAFAVMLGAGLAGIENDYPCPAVMEHDTYRMSPAELAANSIESLPGDLYGATLEASKSKLIRETLGEELAEKFLANKFEEWDRYRVQVTDYELRTYLPAL
jgi:glutamine synthetase